MKNISERRKLKGSGLAPSDDDWIKRTNTNNSKIITNTAPPSSQDLQRVIKDLEAMVKEER